MKLRPETTSERRGGANICWWPLDNSGFHPNGANFTPSQMCDVVDQLVGSAHDIPPSQHWELIKKRGQRIDCTMTEWNGALKDEAPFGPSIGDEDDSRRAEIVRQMKAWMDKAVANDIPLMLCFFGNRSGSDSNAQWQRIDESLVELAGYAEKVGIVLAFEPLNSVDFGAIPLANMKGHPDQFCSDPLEFHRHLSKVGKPKVAGIAFDFYHPAAQNRDEWMMDDLSDSIDSVTDELLSLFDMCYEYIVHIHVAGVFVDDARMRGELHLRGQLIDYRHVMDHVWKKGYQGRFLIEYVTTEGIVDDEDKPFDLKERQGYVTWGLIEAQMLCMPRDF